MKDPVWWDAYVQGEVRVCVRGIRWYDARAAAAELLGLPLAAIFVAQRSPE